MGRISFLKSFNRTERNGAKVSDMIVDPGGGSDITAEHFAPIGDDSVPLPGDFALIENEEGTGRKAVVGYLDPKNTQESQAGEKRIYARAESGQVVVQIWLKNDGEAVMINNNGYFRLEPSGLVMANGARITTDGDVITASGVSLDNHPHNQGNDSAGDVQQPTDAPTATE